MPPDRLISLGAGGMLVNPHAGRVDHLQVAVVSSVDTASKSRSQMPRLRQRRKRLPQVVCGRSAPGCQRPRARAVRSRQKIPFSTRRSSTRSLPRTSVGNSARSITAHSASVRSNRGHQGPPAQRANDAAVQPCQPLWVRDLDLGVRRRHQVSRRVERRSTGRRLVVEAALPAERLDPAVAQRRARGTPSDGPAPCRWDRHRAPLGCPRRSDPRRRACSWRHARGNPARRSTRSCLRGRQWPRPQNGFTPIHVTVEIGIHCQPLPRPVMREIV